MTLNHLDIFAIINLGLNVFEVGALLNLLVILRKAYPKRKRGNGHSRNGASVADLRSGDH